MDYVKVTTDGLMLWECPGCNDMHSIWTHPTRPNPYGLPKHTWNGSKNSPTISQIIINKTSNPITNTPKVCCCYIRDGQIDFLSESTHRLAGYIVPMLPWD